MSENSHKLLRVLIMSASAVLIAFLLSESLNRRFHIISGEGTAYVVDRYDGSMRHCHPAGCRDLRTRTDPATPPRSPPASPIGEAESNPYRNLAPAK